MISFGLVPLLLAIPILLALRIVYRLFFHPLADIPGPRWAAITSLYGASYDLPQGSNYTQKILELHKEYGPVIRILPNHVHVVNMQSYDEIFRSGSKFHRAHIGEYENPAMMGSTWNVREPGEARVRRGVYLPFFSRQSIQQVECLIQKQMLKFFSKLETLIAAAPTEPIDLTMGYKCMTADVIMEYIFRKSMGFLDAPRFQSELILALDDWFKNLPLGWYCNGFNKTIFRLMSALPDSAVKIMMPILAKTKWLKDQCNHRVHELMVAEQTGTAEKTSQRSMFENAIRERPQTGEARIEESDLCSDAWLFFAAGTDTTANTLAFGTWYLLNNKEALSKLKAELKESIPDPRSAELKSWQDLEKLPYLAAVIKESVRLSFGAVHRQGRIAPKTDHYVEGYKIPAGTIISHSTAAYHLSDVYFKNASSFVPERWLDTRDVETRHNMVAFPRGARSCIGENLAWAELYLVFAYMFRRFEIECAGTTAKDMEWTDYFVPYTKDHLRARLRLVSE